MTGLIDGWASLPRVTLHEETTSASGARRLETFEAIPLAAALSIPIETRVLVTAADGLMLALTAEDAARAMLTETDGGWQLILSGDHTRQRRVKHPIAFATE